MCTGDAVLTAIACARDVRIIPTCAPVYVPRLRGSVMEEKKSSNGIEWVNVDDGAKTLDPYTLDPTDSDSQQKNLKLKDIGMAITGETFAHVLAHCPKETLERILVHAQVFARMSPEQKGELVENLHQLGWTVSFVGDGCNDVVALRA